MLATHRVSGMNFIPGGYAILAAVQDARAEAESQLIASALAETDTQLPSPNVEIDYGEDEEDVGEPSTPPEDVNPDQQAMPPPQLQTLSASNPVNLTSQKSKSLQVNIQEPPSEELILGMMQAFSHRFHLQRERLLFRRRDSPHRALQCYKTYLKKSSRLLKSAERR